jgi:pantothenate kinase
MASPTGAAAPERLQLTTQQLCARLEDMVSQRAGSAAPPLLVALVGVPGSGKSTAVQHVLQELRARNGHLGSGWVSPLPMDGFHLPRSALDAMVRPDPATAHARRGSPFTFDASALRECLRVLATTRGAGGGGGGGETASAAPLVVAPGFDHAEGDPVPGAHVIGANTRLVLAEGNYLLLGRLPPESFVERVGRVLGGHDAGNGAEATAGGSDAQGRRGVDEERALDPAWRDVTRCFDACWFLDVSVDEAMERVTRRNLAQVPSFRGLSPAQAKARVDANDRINAELVARCRDSADLVGAGAQLNRRPRRRRRRWGRRGAVTWRGVTPHRPWSKCGAVP